MSVEKIPVEANDESPKPPITVYQTVKNTMSVSNEAFVNGILLTVAALLLVGILATYFVKDLPDVILDIREISKQALWVFIGGYAIGELLKFVFINRARVGNYYTEIRDDAKKALKKIVEAGKADRIGEYCKWYAQELFSEKRRLVLQSSDISLEAFEEKYVALSKKEILKRYPDCALSKKQFKAIKKANAVEMEIYNPEFLSSALGGNVRTIPSKRYNVKSRNVKNAISSIVFGAVSSLFGVSFANELIFHFSQEIIVAAVIKVILLLLTVALKIVFAQSLVYDTEVGRFKLQEEEAAAYLRWYDETK